MRNSILFVLVVASLESGCGAKLPSMKPFKMDIQQGNVVTSKMLMQLRPGMTRSQVRYIMGTPLIVDSFRDNRWDYFYEMREQGQVVEKRRVILDFDKDSLVAVRGDVIPSAENPEIKTIAEAPAKKTVEQKADQKDESWTDKLKFWQGDDAAKPVTPAQTDGANAVVPAGTTDKVEPVASANNQPEATQVTPVATQAVPTAVAEEEIVPHIPEGEYKASPSPQEMVQANPAEANTPSVAASAQAVNEKTMAAQIADTVEPPTVFEQDAVAPTVAEPVAELPPPQPAAPVAATSRATTTNVPAASVPVARVAAATATVAAAETTAKSKNSKKSPAAKAQSKPVAATPVTKPVSPPATVNMAEDDEVIPYIPEGEYQAPVIPTEQEMINGNMAEANVPATDAQAHQVTEKGVAPKTEAASEPAPTFIAEQLPEPEPEPDLPPPPPPVAKPVVKETLAKESVVQAPATPEPAIAAAPIAAADTFAESQAAMPAAPALPAETERAKPVVAAAASVTNTEAESPALSTDAEINQAVANWAQAWRSKNIKTYLAAYAPDFVPEALPNKAAWEAQRKQRLSPSQGPITLVLNNIQVQRDGSAATVQFEQKYAAKAYKDALNKTLEMRYEPMQKRWLITRERVASIPAAAAVEATPKVELTASPVAAPQVQGESQALSATPEVSVEAAVDAWAQAWRNKNVNTYLAAYSPEFVPEGLPSRSAWEAQRKKRLSPQQGKITLELGELSVAREGDTAVVIFSQKYASKAYRDEMVKRLQLKLDSASKRWLIVRETVASAADVPAAKQQVTAPEGSAEQPDEAAEPIGF